MRTHPRRTILAWASLTVLSATAAFVVGCGGGGSSTAESPLDVQDAEDSRAEALGVHRPVVIASYGPNVVSRWHTVAADVVAQPTSPAGATPSERRTGPDLATVMLAIYDAVVAIDGGYEPYGGRPSAPAKGASMDAAANEAAYRVLLALFPSHQARYQGLYDETLAAIPDGPPRSRGITLGAEVAGRLLALRADDGREAAFTPFLAGSAPGDFRGVNPINQWAPYIRPFSVRSLEQFAPDGPPELDSRRYARDFAEVAAYGGTASTVRTAEQLEAARFHTEPPPRFTPRNLGRFATASPKLAENARLMAMLWTAYHDALNSCFTAKYRFRFWRPASAIPLADTDGNDATVADPGWTPVLPTPNHPEYPSAHSCFTGSATETLRQFYGTRRISFAFDSTVTGTEHAYGSTRDLIEEVTNARVWGGMHFRSANDDGVKLGRQVAHWVAEHHFKARGGRDHH